MRTSPEVSSQPGAIPQRIVHAVEAFASGVLHVIESYANATAAAGISTVVVHGRRPETPSPRELRALFDPEVELRELTSWGNRGAAGALFGAARAARVILGELDPDVTGVLHLHSFYAGALGRSLPRPRAWRVLYSPHAFAFLNDRLPYGRRTASLLVERALQRRAEVVAVSDHEADLTRQRLPGVPAVHLVRNGVSPAIWRNPTDGSGSRSFVRRGRNRPLVCCVGRAEPQRAPDLLCTASALLHGAADLRWIGDGEWRLALEASGVEVTGWLPRHEARRLVEQSDIVVHLARFDGMPLALLEAMVARRPIVSLDTDVAREALGESALYVQDAAGLACAVARLIADEGLRGELGSRGALRVHDLFSVAAMTRAALRVYALPAALW